MIITKTPLRVSLFGGGTDYPSYFQHQRGSVLGGTINKYVYVHVSDLAGIADETFRIQYRSTQSTNKIDEIEHPAVRAILGHFNWTQKINISTVSDLPGSTGLGSSSSFTVGLLSALLAKSLKKTSDIDLAKLAIKIEQHYLDEKVGVQDQLHAACGGFSRYDFFQNTISKNNLKIKKERIKTLNESSILIYTGAKRAASIVLNEQHDRNEDKINDQFLLRMFELVDEAQSVFEKSSDQNFLREVGELLKESWGLKKNLSNKVTNPIIDEIIETGCQLGAYGAKLLGAGHHGFVYFIGESHTIQRLKNHFGEQKYVEFKFQEHGTKSIMI
jgi:D-glycero-alpha-D-manno-heptose-7-phosphate kinase